jgi:hypothetical protein
MRKIAITENIAMSNRAHFHAVFNSPAIRTAPEVNWMIRKVSA